MGVERRAFGVGDTIAGRYRVDGTLGEGGFGAVFSATHVETGAPVAVKVLHAHHFGREAEVKRFHREAQLASRLDHPNIVKTLDYGTTPEGVPFIVLELLSGESLSARLKAEGALGVSRVGQIALQVLDALGYAHAQDIVHRDIKPANVFLCAGKSADFARVIDFGIAKALAPDGESHLTRLTSTGQILGSPQYMAPEQIKGAAFTPTVDLYALGLVLAEALTGRRVIAAKTDIEVLMTHMSNEPIPLSETVLDSPLAGVIRRALEKDPARRFGSAGEMRAAVVQALEGHRASHDGGSAPQPPPQAGPPSFSASRAAPFVPAAQPQPAPGPPSQAGGYAAAPALSQPVMTPPAPVKRGGVGLVLALIGVVIAVPAAAVAVYYVVLPDAFVLGSGRATDQSVQKAAPASATGIAECDEYLKLLDCSIKGVDPALREMTLKPYRDHWRAAYQSGGGAMAALECKQALGVMRPSLRNTGCR